MASHPSSRLLALLAALLLLLFFFTLTNNSSDHLHLHLLPHPKFVSPTPRHPEGFSVLLTAAFSLALKDPAHAPLRLHIFDHHHPSRQPHHIFIVEGDLHDDARLFCKLSETVPLSQILRLDIFDDDHHHQPSRQPHHIFIVEGDLDNARLFRKLFDTVPLSHILGLDIFDNDHHYPSHQPHHIFIVEGDLEYARLFCKLFETVPLSHILYLDIFDDLYHHHPSHKAHHIFVVEDDLHDARLFCKISETVPFAHIFHQAAQSNIDGFVNLLDIANAANPKWASSISISGLVTKNPFSELRTSRINHKARPTITTIGQVDRTAVKKWIQERASLVKSIASKQAATVGVQVFNGDPNIPEKEAINELGKSDGEGTNIEEEKSYKLFPHMYRFGRRRLLYTSKGSSAPTPPAPMAESKARGWVIPSGPSPCTHIPGGDGHC